MKPKRTIPKPFAILDISKYSYWNSNGSILKADLTLSSKITIIIDSASVWEEMMGVVYHRIVIYMYALFSL